MKKKYLVEFTMADGSVENIELITDNIEFSIDQWSRHRAVSNYEILKEGKTNSKRMLFG